MSWTNTGRVLIGTLAGAILSPAGVHPRIDVCVYDYGHVPKAVLADAEKVASTIYSREGIEIDWRRCPVSAAEVREFGDCDAAPIATTVVLRLISGQMAGLLRTVEGSFGFAMQPDDRSFPTFANVFADDIQEFASRTGRAADRMLGHVIAHELGHLFLGEGGHSASGIMRKEWLENEINGAEHNSMRFGPGDRDRMRAAIRLRMRFTVENPDVRGWSRTPVQVRKKRRERVSQRAAGHADGM